MSKLILFPIRILSIAFNGISSVSTPLFLFIGYVIRILTGLAFVLIGAGLFFAGFVMINLIVTGYLPDFADQTIRYFESYIPIPILLKLFTDLTYWIIFLFFTLLSIFLIILGINFWFKKNYLKPYVGWVIFFGLVGCLLVGYSTLPNFREEFNIHTTHEETIPIPSSTALLKSFPDDTIINTTKVYLKVAKSGSSRARVLMSAYGKSEEEALSNAMGIKKMVESTEETLIIAPSLSLEEDTPYRGQEVVIQLYMQPGHVFQLNRRLAAMLSTENLFEYGISSMDLTRYRWQFENDELVCIDCDLEEIRKKSFISARQSDSEIIPINNFDELIIDGMLNVSFVQSEQAFIQIYSDDKEFDAIDIDNYDQTLRLTNSSSFGWGSFYKLIHSDLERPLVRIGSNDLNTIKISGNTSLTCAMLETQSLEIGIEGASEIKGQLYCKDLEIRLSGGSYATIKGQSTQVISSTSGASKADLEFLEATQAFVETYGASQVVISVRERLKAIASGASGIRYSGNPEVRADRSGAAKIERIH